MKKFSIIFVFIMLFLTFFSFLVWNVYSIDKTVTKGKVSGFVIGISMDEAFHVLKNNSQKFDFVAVQVGNNPKNFKIIRVDSLLYKDLENYNSWLIMIGRSHDLLNTLKLHFDKKGKLIRLYRNRKFFELP